MSGQNNRRRATLASLLLLACSLACRPLAPDPATLRPRTLGEVPSERLAYRFAADAGQPATPEADETPWPAVQADFEARRKEEALLRTVVSPDGQRVLALYAGVNSPEGIFRIDMYAADGAFVRNMTPPDMACAFLPTVSWSPDGQSIAFIARRNDGAAVIAATPTPPPLSPLSPSSPNAATAPPSPGGVPGADAPPAEGATVPTPAPIFAAVPVYPTEQIYVCDRDGFSLRPLTARDGLIYFRFAWAPAGGPPSLVALACKEDEWQQSAAEGRAPAGRPRLLTTNGEERLLDDRLTDVPPVWSPDAAKVATAFDTEVAVYDATPKPTVGARINLRDALFEASRAYDREQLKTAPEAAASGGSVAAKPGENQATPTPPPSPAPDATPAAEAAPISFNPVIRLIWPQPGTLYAETGFVRIYGEETISNYLRWHTLSLSPQAVPLNPARR